MGRWLDFSLAGVAILSALTAMISAWLAYQSNRGAAKKERDARVRDLSLIANKVMATTLRIDDLAGQLKMAYRDLFSLAGHGPKSSRLEYLTSEIEKKQESIGPMQYAARQALASGVANLSDDQINERLLEFDGFLAHLDTVREKLNADLASVEAQSQTFT